MLSRGKFYYIRSLYRNIEKLRKFNELFGETIQVGFTIPDPSGVLHCRPIEPQPRVYPYIQDRSSDIQYPSDIPLIVIPVEKGPEDVTYI